MTDPPAPRESAPHASAAPDSSFGSSSTTSEVTIFLPRDRGAAGEDTPGSRPESTPSLPPDIREQATRRLQMIAITYSVAFFLADLFPSLVTGEMVGRLGRPLNWLPTVISVIGGLVVAFWASRPGVRWETRVHVGLVFEILGSYGIACSQYIELPAGLPVEVLHVLSPSWVAIWTLFYSIAMPTPPRKALLAAIASVSAAPVVIGLTMQRAGLSHVMPPAHFFFMHVFPYAIVVLLAYVGSRVVHQLGKDVSRARELGSYRLVERLGQGGMGEVWRATHRFLARPAAIKFIRPETLAASNPDEARHLLKRFEREAQATASMTSPHTVSLYDFGATEDGTFYYVMELLDGVDLDRLVRRFGPLPPARIVHLLAQACESLDEAHAKGLIHRDVKPANLYACRSGSRTDFVKILDFGLVARSRVVAGAEPALTQAHQAAGTPSYMPPEVARGEKIDGRTDLYALGCVAYWMATGKPLFAGASVYEVVAQHLQAQPPSTREGSNPMPAELDAVIARCLSKSPEQRPATARELARLLRAVPLRDRWGDEEAEAWWAANLPAA